MYLNDHDQSVSPYLKRNLPLSPLVRLMVGWSVGHSVMIASKERKFNFHAPIGALVIPTLLLQKR